MKKLFTLLLGIIAFSCSYVSSDAGQKDSSTTQNRSSTSPSNVHEIPSTNGRVFIKDGGWELPAVQLEESETGEYTDKTIEGQKVHITEKVFHIKPPYITEDPLKSVGLSLGHLQLRTDIEYRFLDRPFCLKFDASRVEVDENNKITSSHGSVFFFSYYDEDGDGTFEALVFDEKDSDGIISIGNRPHLPKWIKP